MTREPQRLWIVDGNAHPLAVNIIDTFLDPHNYIISLTRLKTHSDVVATLSVKNIVMGSPVSHYKQIKAEGRNEKSFMHSGGFKNIHFNIFLIAQHARPQLSILDGLEGMEGNGPDFGYRCRSRSRSCRNRYDRSRPCRYRTHGH